MRPSAFTLPLLYAALVAAAPHVPRQELVDPNNPSSSNPQSPPSSFQDAPRPAENIFQNGLTPVPAECTDFQKPSDACLSALMGQDGDVVAFSGGSLKFDDKSCTDEQKSFLETAAWDALTLGTYASFHSPPKSARDIASWKTYMGPNYAEYQQRISDNFSRVKDFKTNKKFDIIISCKDTQNKCDMKVDGKSVGGYAWTYKGWFGTYQYITLCPPFFTLDTLEEKITFVEDALQRGELKYAEGAEWQKNSGQYFLHEMMHLDSIGIPHINDEKYDPREPSSAYAYGPRVVYKLAQRSLNQMGGAERASTNADSYAWLANIIYFWDLTNYFPKPPGFKVADLDDISSGGEDRAQDVFPIHLGEITAETSEEELQSRFQTALEGWKTAEPPAALPPANDISPPDCATEGIAFPQPPAEASIDSFCNQRQYWDTVLVPSVSFGTGQTNDGRGKALGVSEVYNLEGTSDKLWLGVFFARDGCVGSTPFTLGQTDQEKLDHCKARFGTVLNGCHTDTMTGKKGGTLRDGCAVYTVTTRPNGEKPFEGWDANQGDFTCKETDTSAIGGPASPLHGTCTCWYSGYPGLIDTFKMPASKNCADVNRAELVNN